MRKIWNRLFGRKEKLKYPLIAIKIPDYTDQKTIDKIKDDIKNEGIVIIPSDFKVEVLK